MTRRVKQLRIVPDALMLIFQPGVSMDDGSSDIPGDARVVHSAIDGRGDIILTIASESFSEVDILEGVPQLVGPSFTRSSPK